MLFVVVGNGIVADAGGDGSVSVFVLVWLVVGRDGVVVGGGGVGVVVTVVDDDGDVMC